jgi:hypothetical protein
MKAKVSFRTTAADHGCSSIRSSLTLEGRIPPNYFDTIILNSQYTRKDRNNWQKEKINQLSKL